MQRRTTLLSIAACAAAVLLPGCASPGRDARVVVGRSTTADLIGYYGQPVHIWPEPDGGQTFEYSTQPFGHSCIMARFGPDLKLLQIEDTLLEASRARVLPGMTQEQVSRLLGRERRRMFFPLSGEDVWDWNVPFENSGYLLRFNVHFVDGKVVRASNTMVPLDRRMLWD